MTFFFVRCGFTSVQTHQIKRLLKSKHQSIKRIIRADVCPVVNVQSVRERARPDQVVPSEINTNQTTYPHATCLVRLAIAREMTVAVFESGLSNSGLLEGEGAPREAKQNFSGASIPQKGPTWQVDYPV